MSFGHCLSLKERIIANNSVVSFSRKFLSMLLYFPCFGARDIVVMQSVTKFRTQASMFSRGLYFLLCSLIFQFDAVARTSFFKYRVLSMNLYLLVKELERKRWIKQDLLYDAWTSNLGRV